MTIETITALKSELAAIQAEWDVCDCADECDELEQRMADLHEQIEAAINGETFVKERFNWDGTFLTYTRLTGENVFVARFKYAAQKKRKAVYRRALAGQNVGLYLKLAEMTSPAEALSRMTGELA